MADTKISALTAANTPLTGTEVVPIVQSSVTKQVAVSDIGTKDHTALSNLAWASSGHTGTASNFAAFSGAGAADEITATEATALLNAFAGDSGAGGTKGLVPAPAAGDAAAGKYLDSDGTWTVPPSGGASPYTIESKTAGFTVVAGDFGKIFHCSGASFTISLTSAATLGAGFYCTIMNQAESTETTRYIITIDPDGSETIDTKSSWIIRGREGLQIYSNGTNWETGYVKANASISVPTLNTHKAIASGEYAVAIGADTTASAQWCVAVGTRTTTASAGRSVAVGVGATSSGGVLAIGGTVTASGTGSTAIGYSATASAVNSLAIGYTVTAATIGKYAYSNGYFAANADSCYGVYVLRIATTNDILATLTTNGAAPASTNLITLPNNGAFAMRGLVIGRKKVSEANEVVMFEFSGLARRGANAASTAIVGTITPTQTAADAALSGCTLTVTADTTNGGVALTVAGIAATNIRWTAVVHTSEVIYA